jgi:hypothetical protein
MRITNISSEVRIVDYSFSEVSEVAYDLRVEQQIEGKWETVWETNTISNDYAYTEVREHAFTLARRLFNESLSKASKELKK